MRPRSLVIGLATALLAGGGVAAATGAASAQDFIACPAVSGREVKISLGFEILSNVRLSSVIPGTAPAVMCRYSSLLQTFDTSNGDPELLFESRPALVVACGEINGALRCGAADQVTDNLFTRKLLVIPQP